MVIEEENLLSMKTSIQAFEKIFKQLYYILNKSQRRGALAVFCCMLLSSLLELLGVSIIYPFLQLMLDVDELQEKWYILLLYRFVPNASIKTLLLMIAMLIVIVYILKNALMLVSIYVQNSFAARFQKENSIRVLDAYLKKPYQYFLNANSSIILRGITSDVSGTYLVLLNCFTICSELLNVVALGVFLFVTDTFISICALTLALICFLAIVFNFKNRMKTAGIQMRQATNLKYQYSYQAINGIKEITVLNRRENFISQFEKAAKLEEKISVINGFVTACPDRILEGICIAGFMGIVCIKIMVSNDLSNFIPVLGTFAMAAFRILPSISKISSRLNSIIFNKPCLDSTYSNLKEIEEYEKQHHSDRNKQLQSNTEVVKDISFHDKLEVKNLWWRYLEAKDYVLKELNITIYKGESVAFIGTSGAGKSTLADVIMGLLKPQIGTLEVDGKDIYMIPEEWAKMVGYVPQAVFLIDDTIRNNIAFGIDKEKISDEKVWLALKQAQLSEFVVNLEKGLDTIVGERGVRLSGGQRQRIAIARALYEQPDILVLDEATSALDNETENAVMEAIESLQGTKTLIIVAHRLATIKNCDKVYEIMDGEAIERKKEEILS